MRILTHVHKHIYVSLVKPDRECPELEHPSLGSVVTSGRTFGSRASYTCNHGYHVVGLQTRICQGYGHWSGMFTKYQ